MAVLRLRNSIVTVVFAASEWEMVRSFGGRVCHARKIYSGVGETNGCRSGDQHNDGVVCEDSASLTFRQNNLPLLTPTQPWVDSLNPDNGLPGRIQHYPYLGPVIFNVLCPTINGAASLSNPLPITDLFQQLRNFLDAL